MAKDLSWFTIEENLRMALVLMADAARYMVGCGPRGDRAAAAILGLPEAPSTHLDDLIHSDGFLHSVVLTDTTLANAAKRCFDLVTVRNPLDTICVGDERVEGTEWLSYFLSTLPREAMGGWDFTGIASHSDAPLVVLLNLASARLSLAEFAQDLLSSEGLKTSEDDIETPGFLEASGFTAGEIAALAGVEVRTVRNVMGPKGDKPILSRGLNKTDWVRADPLDALEWLAGRRGFQPGRLSPAWVNTRLANVKNFEVAAALPGVMNWLNPTTTEDFAAQLGWPVERLRKWLRAQENDPVDARAIAAASGLDPVVYRSLIEKLKPSSDVALNSGEN